MAFSSSSAPSFLSRLSRVFTSSTRTGISGDASSGAVFSATSSSLASTIPEGFERATVAAGCFWGVEHRYRERFSGTGGLHSCMVGYIGGDLSNPSYSAVCKGQTGHAEATQIVYDPAKITYQQLLEFFYRMHDPTTKDAQGPDRGSQYRSGIFFHSADQQKLAREVTRKVNEQWWGGKVVTEVLPAGQWWDAEEYHQLYLHKNPFGYDCPSHVVRKFPDLK